MPKKPGKQDETRPPPARNALGQLLPGHSGNYNGRPRKMDLRALVEAHNKAVIGETIQESVLAVWSSLVARAKKGDVQAIKLVLDRICETDAVELDITHRPAMTTAERAARVTELLERAKQRAGENHEDEVRPDSGGVRAKRKARSKKPRAAGPKR